MGFDERKKQNLFLYVDGFANGVRPRGTRWVLMDEWTATRLAKPRLLYRRSPTLPLSRSAPTEEEIEDLLLQKHGYGSVQGILV